MVFFTVAFLSLGSAVPLELITIVMVRLIPIPRVQLAEGKGMRMEMCIFLITPNREMSCTGHSHLASVLQGHL